MSKPQVIFFDAGGTLFRPYPSVGAVYAKVAAKHGVQVDAGTSTKPFMSSGTSATVWSRSPG